MACPVCKTEEIENKYPDLADYEYSTISSVDYIRCSNCGLISQKPLPKLEEIESFYPEDYRNYMPLGSGLFTFLKKYRFNQQAKKLAKYIPNEKSKILEIGYGNGQLLVGLKDLDYHKLYGQDFSNNASHLLKLHGVQTVIGNAEKELGFKEEFDVIILNNVIEHFLDPEAVIKNCKKKLAPGGKIILLTPNTDAWDLKFFAKHWAGFHAPRHTFLFNKNNLSLLAHNCGFAKSIFHQEPDAAQWGISMQNKLQDSFLKTKLKNGMAFYTLALVALFMPFSIIQNLCGNSESMLCIFEA